MKPLGLTRCRLIPQIKAFVHRHWADRSGPSYCRAPIIPMKNTRSPFPDVLIASLLAMTIQSEAPAGTTPPPAPEATPTPPANPLSFADGRVVLSLENMSRFEFRQNTYDFDNGVDSHFPGTGPQATEVYALYLNDDDRDDDFVTVGTHWKSTPEALGPWRHWAPGTTRRKLPGRTEQPAGGT